MKLKIKSNISSKYLSKKNGLSIISISKIFNKLINESKNKNSFYYMFNNNYTYNFLSKNFNKFKKFKKIVIIGMGGSILGSKAIFSFLNFKIKKNVEFIDNLDPVIIDRVNKDFKASLFILISKSGGTLELLTNVNALHSINFTSKNTIILTENKNSSLQRFSKEKKITLVNHNKLIGGRYSVLSEVGMLPSYLMGLKVKKFRSNFKKLLKGKFKEEICKQAKNSYQIYSSKKINSLVCLNYSPVLNDLILWCQQLFSESLGKKGKGLLPMLSVAPKDHHSLLQLYLDGPKDKLFYIFTCKEDKKKILSKNLFEKKHNFFKKKSYSDILSAQKNALIKVFKKKNIPFKEIIINNRSEEILVEFFTFFIFETIIIAKLLKLNPFDQPAVELVKSETKSILI